MEYKGKLYGKVGNQYFPMIDTTMDVDALREKIKELEKQINDLSLGGVGISLPSEKDIHNHIISEMKNCSDTATAYFRRGADWMIKNIKQ